MRGNDGKAKGDPSVEAAGGLTHMVREKDDRDELTQPSGPSYPPGLQIHLDHGELEKLGHHEHSHTAGDQVHFHAKGHISEAREEVRDGKREQHLSIQLTHVGIHHPADGFKAEDQGGKDLYARRRQ